MSTETEPVTLDAEIPFYLSRDNEVYGPHLVGQIQELLDSAVIFPGDLIWMEGWQEWQPIQAVFALESAGAEAAANEGSDTRSEGEFAPIGDRTPVLADSFGAIGEPAPPADTAREELMVPRISADGLTKRMLLGAAAAFILHLGLFCLAMFVAASLFKVVPYAHMATPAAPPPLEVAFVPEEEPPPPTPTPPAQPPPAPPPPDLQPPPPPAPPVIPMPTIPPPLLPAMPTLPTPPLISDLPVSPSAPQHTLPRPKRAATKASSAPSALSVPTSPQVTDAGPSDYLYAPPPDYPFAMQKRRQGGTVILRVIVSEAGDPTSVIIQRSCGYSALDQSALSTVRDQYRFRVGNSRILLVPISFQPPR